MRGGAEKGKVTTREGKGQSAACFKVIAKMVQGQIYEPFQSPCSES